MVSFIDLGDHTQVVVNNKNSVAPKNSLYLQENEHGIISVFCNEHLIATDNFNDFSPNAGTAAATIQAIAPLIFL